MRPRPLPPPLSKLNLSGNEIGNKGSVTLAMALREEQTMARLDLSNCFFGDDPVAAFEFREALALNASLTNVNLSGNLFPDNSAREFLDLMKRNDRLVSLGQFADLHTPRVEPALFKEMKRQQTLNKKAYLKRLKKLKRGKRRGKGKGKSSKKKL